MKKSIFAFLTVAIVISMVVGAFAMPYSGADDPKYYGDGTNDSWGGDSVGAFGILCDFEQEDTWGTSICGKELSSFSTQLRTRNDWTPTREGVDPTGIKDDPAWTAHVVENGAAGNHAVEIDKPFAIWNDYDLDENYRLQCDFKPVKVAGFMGIAIEFTENLKTDTVPAEVSNSDGVALITKTGIGFTFVQNDKNSVYVFANGKGAKINLGIDLTAKYRSFALYNNCEDGYTYFTINEKIFAKVDWTGDATKILDADDNELATAGVIPQNPKTAIVCFTGSETHAFFDNLWVSAPEYKVPTEKYVVPENPEEPEQPEEPEEPRKTGDVSILVAIVAVAALAVVVLKKRENV